jgi:hypothetical protein
MFMRIVFSERGIKALFVFSFIGEKTEFFLWMTNAVRMLAQIS